MPVTPTIEVDDTLKERSSHGSFELPIETYTDNCQIFHSLYNHWHDEMELICIRPELPVRSGGRFMSGTCHFPADGKSGGIYAYYFSIRQQL